MVAMRMKFETQKSRDAGWLLSLVLPILLCAPDARAATAELNDLSINGGVQDGKARLVIEALLKGSSEDRDRVLFATSLEHLIQVSPDKIAHSLSIAIEVMQGEPKEIPLTLTGDGEVLKVTGDNLQDWSIRQEPGGARVLVLRPRKTDKPLTHLAVTVVAEREYRSWPRPVTPLALAPPQPALFHG